MPETGKYAYSPSLEDLRIDKLKKRTEELEMQLLSLQKEFAAFKKFRIDKHISWNCARGTCNSCKGRSCRHECHNKKIEEC